MGIIDSPPGFITGGSIKYRGIELLEMKEKARRQVRGDHVSMVFQDALTALNPVFTVGSQIAEVLRRHMDMSRAEAASESARLLTRVGIPDARGRLGDHPHQFSGGQRQRIMIAMALACRPAVMVADEPTTALDVTVQAEIVALVRELQQEMGMAVLWITHDLALAADVVDRVAVMYAGAIVEEAPVADLFRSPRHPYTRGLLDALPRLEEGGEHGASDRLRSIPGRPPVLVAEPEGCTFAPRCPWVTDRCRRDVPRLAPGGPGAGDHRAACWHQDALP